MIRLTTNNNNNNNVEFIRSFGEIERKQTGSLLLAHAHTIRGRWTYEEHSLWLEMKAERKSTWTNRPIKSGLQINTGILYLKPVTISVSIANRMVFISFISLFAAVLFARNDCKNYECYLRIAKTLAALLFDLCIYFNSFHRISNGKSSVIHRPLLKRKHLKLLQRRKHEVQIKNSNSKMVPHWKISCSMEMHVLA